MVLMAVVPVRWHEAVVVMRWLLMMMMKIMYIG